MSDWRTELANGGFRLDEELEPVSFVNTTDVAPGVLCGVYHFTRTDERDLAIVEVDSGARTPLQLVLLGDKTIEMYLGGSGGLKVVDQGVETTYNFDVGDKHDGVAIHVGQLVQWTAGPGGLVFGEICEPPYADGRFENIPE